MTNRKFEVVSERELGRMTPDQLVIWKKLEQRRKRLEASEAILEEDTELFITSFLKDHNVENHAAATGIELREDGIVVQQYCECYKCQAGLQGMSPSLVVEAMVRQQRIDPVKIAEARKWAAGAEKQLGRNLLN